MPKKRYMALILTAIMLLCACSMQPNDTPTQTQETAVTEIQITVPTEETAAVEPTQNTVPTQPLHSEIYLPGYSAEQITEYFAEVVLDVEYSDGTGDISLVQKWLWPVYYQIYGSPTEADLEVLKALCLQLNSIPGFPGIYPAEDASQENFSISFLEQAAFDDSFSDVINGEDAFGAVQFWYYTDTNEIHTARIGCRTDIGQSPRDSVLVEEIINALGITDTELRPDSITYQYSDDNTALSDVDLVILKLLYSNAIQCGMDYDSCAAMIRELYY